MDHTTSDTAQALGGDSKAVEAWLKNLWDRTKKAAELIARLRSEKEELQAMVKGMEDDLERLRRELALKEEQVRTLSAQAQHQSQHALVLDGEREVLRSRVRELLARLEAYL